MWKWKINRYGIDFEKDNQETRLLKYLQYNEGKWCKIWEMMRVTKICHYCEVVRKLRKKGYKIENRMWVDEKNKSITHSAYKLIRE